MSLPIKLLRHYPKRRPLKPLKRQLMWKEWCRFVPRLVKR